ncbi:MAG: galactokinase [Ignavibacteria bacterium]|nr:galactokinase [Ignavibacteria bacterium]
MEPVIFRSPGRINLIGEHTDYNEGFVLPAAIDKAIYFAISKRADRTCTLYANDFKEEFKFELDNFSPVPKHWANYLMGVVDQLLNAGYQINGFNCVFGGDVPIGAGLSSSAAIEAGLAFALNSIFDLQIDKLDLVKMSQKAEHKFAGVRCGIMDQFINIFGKENNVLKLDCRSLNYEYFPFILNDYEIILCDTQIKHSLASSEYNIRRQQCEEGVRILQQYYSDIYSLRDVDLDLIRLHDLEFPPKIYDRCTYVVKENHRLLNCCDDLLKGDLISFGKRMFKTHQGLRDEYEVSCKELDLLVDFASEFSGVIGARMMGGGFGGCTINLVEKQKSKQFIEWISEKYFKATSNDLKIYEVKIEGGTSQINL